MDNEAPFLERFFSWYLGLNSNNEYESSFIWEIFVVIFKLMIPVMIVLGIISKLFDIDLIWLSCVIIISLLIFLIIMLSLTTKAINQKIDGLEEKLTKSKPGGNKIII